jgi:hypothetical protein
MAEVVLFKTDLGETITNIKRLEEELKKLKSIYKDAEVGSKEYLKAQQGAKEVTAILKQQNDALKANTNALGGVNSAAKFAEGSYGKLKQQIKENKAALDAAVEGSKEFDEALKERIRLENQRIAIEEKIPSLLQKRIQGGIEEANTIQELKQQIKEYTNAVIRGEEGAAQKLAELKDKLDDVKDATSTFKGSGVEQLTSSMGLLRESIGNLDFDKFKTSLDGISNSMKAIPLLIVIEGIKLIYENFDTLVQSGGFLGETLKVIGEGFKGLSDDLIEFSDYLGLTNVEAQKLYDTFIENQNKLIKNEERSIDIIKFGFDEKIKLLKSEGKSTTDIEIQKQNEIKKSADLRLSLLDEEKKKTLEKYKDDAVKRQEELSKIQENYIALQKESISAENEITIIKNIAEKERIENAEKARKQREENAKKEKDELLKIQKELQEGIKRNQQEEISFLTSAIQERKNLNQQSFNEEKELAEYQLKIVLQDRNSTYEQIYAAQVEFDAKMIELQKNQLAYEKQLQDEAFQKDIEARQTQQNIIIEEEQAWNEVNFSDAMTTLETQFEAKQELLNLQREQELYGLEENSLKYQEIVAKYANQEVELLRQKEAEKAAIRTAEIKLVTDTAQVILNLGALLAKDQEQQAAFAKMSALINIGANTATAISNLTATSFSVSSPDNILTGGLAAYAKLATGLVTITSNMVQAKQLLNSFEEGGYTGEGNPHEQSTNLGTKSYTYHKDEYVIPSRVLNTQKGSMLASQLEGMRLGMSNPMPHIGGMFDGGFTGRSASSSANMQLSNQAMMERMMLSMPQPVVRVTDINKTQTSVERAVQVSSL